MSDTSDGRAVIDAAPPVRKAHEQVSDGLLALMRSGALGSGERLPTEHELARHFGVSRATIREALRSLTAQQLIRTTKGATGGSFVTLPTVGTITDYIGSTVDLLQRADHVSLHEFLEARELLEIPAARLAAERKTLKSVEKLRQSIDRPPLIPSRQAGFVNHASFHAIVIEAAENSLLYIAAQPVFAVLQRSLAEYDPGAAFDTAVDEHHVEITNVIERGDGDGAARLMKEHLDFLRPYHERAWHERKPPRRQEPA